MDTPTPRSPSRAKYLVLAILIIVVVCVLLSLNNRSASNPGSETPHAVTGQGATSNSAPFTLSRSTYTVNWSAYPVAATWPFPTWHFGASIHRPGALNSEYHLLFSHEDVSATGTQIGQDFVTGVAPGPYVLDVAAGDPFAWTVTLIPR